MSADHDATEFVDDDFQPSQHAPAPAASQWASPAEPAPTLEEVDSRVAEKQQKLAELKRAQEELERERAALEETRRRQMEFQTGRHEMVHNLTRALGLLEEAEFNARRDAEQMAKALVDFREALTKIEAIREETWTKENFSLELTRALTTLENARMEWNSTRLKLPVLAGESGAEAGGKPVAGNTATAPLAGLNFWQLCKFGLALTWPLLAAALLALGVFVAILLRHR